MVGRDFGYSRRLYVTYESGVIPQYGSVKEINLPETIVETLHVTSLPALTEPYWVIPLIRQQHLYGLICKLIKCVA
jgi:hypothetical protein